MQWFPTMVSWHTRVPSEGAWSAAKYWNNIKLYKIVVFICALLPWVPQIVILGMTECHQFFSPKGCLDPHKAEKHCSNWTICFVADILKQFRIGKKVRYLLKNCPFLRPSLAIYPSSKTPITWAKVYCLTGFLLILITQLK